MLHLYNTLTRSKEAFKPLVAGKVGLYACGITVYDHCHLGHGRSMVAFDVIVRYLRYLGYAVTHVRNITDIDDKIIVRANERKIPMGELTEYYIDAMHRDLSALQVLPPTLEPRATGHMPSIISLIERLVDKGVAYVSESGDVCYEVAQFAEYGKLSHKDIEGLVSGSRVEIVKEKRSPLDFVLWKSAKPGEPFWPSPWGDGRPGWHIECSAMAMEALGEQFDIHGGGSDLQFPHHENEIAQSEAVTHKPFANYWMHVGMLQVDYEKMAKSTGNFLTIADVLTQHHPEVIRYFLLSSHYRSPLNYSHDTVLNAKKALTRLYQAIAPFDALNQDVPDPYWVEKFTAAMDDDVNTPEALAVLFELTHAINKHKDPKLASTLRHLSQILGLLQAPADLFFKAGLSDLEKAEIEALIAERQAAKSNKQWERADTLRDALTAKGVELADGVDGTSWRLV